MKWTNWLVQRVAVAAVVVLSGGLGALATTTVDMTFNWAGTYYQSGYTAPYISSADAIGIYDFTVTPEPNSAGVPNPYWSVCVSPAGLLNGGTYTYNVLSFAQANPGIYPSAWAWNGNTSNPQYWGINNAAYLWNLYGMGIVNNTSSGMGTQNQQAAALEFAVWTALYNSTGYGALGANNWSAPTVQMDTTTLSDYNSYIKALTQSGLNEPIYSGNILESTIAVSGGSGSGASQEFILLGGSVPNTIPPVPEATTLIAGALLLLPFGASTLRILRRRYIA